MGHYSDDDVDGDDFGFLSYPFSSTSFLSTVNKTKSPTPSHRILPRIRKSKTKPLPGAQHACMWSSQVSRIKMWYCYSGTHGKLDIWELVHAVSSHVKAMNQVIPIDLYHFLLMRLSVYSSCQNSITNWRISLFCIRCRYFIGRWQA